MLRSGRSVIVKSLLCTFSHSVLSGGLSARLYDLSRSLSVCLSVLVYIDDVWTRTCRSPLPCPCTALSVSGSALRTVDSLIMPGAVAMPNGRNAEYRSEQK